MSDLSWAEIENLSFLKIYYLKYKLRYPKSLNKYIYVIFNLNIRKKIIKILEN